MNDDCGNVIKLGDAVKVTALNSDRGAFLGITQALGTVVGFGRTRVELQFTSRAGTDRVGGELLRVVEPVDGRQLRLPSDVWNEGGRALPTRPADDVTIFDTFSMDPPPSVLTAGARVRLVHTDDTVTKLRPGDEGTVRGFRLVGDDERLDVAWDSGSTLTMLLNEGDRVEVIR